MVAVVALVSMLVLPARASIVQSPFFAENSRQAAVAPVPRAGPVEGLSCVFDGRTGKPLAPGQASRRVLASDVILVGERHPDASHHAAQKRLLDMVAQHRSGVVGAFEMLYQTHQGALDRYLKGGSELAFLEEVNWKRTWGYDFTLYRPIFESLRSRRLEGLALNVPKFVVRKVATQGLGALTPEERRFVPDDMAHTSDQAYLAMLRATFEQHGGNPNDAAALGRYLDAMTLWNEGMAAGLATRWKARPGDSIIVIVGAGHVYSAAIPEGVARRVPLARETGIILANEANCPRQLSPEALSLASDLVWILTP